MGRVNCPACGASIEGASPESDSTCPLCGASLVAEGEPPIPSAQRAEVSVSGDSEIFDVTGADSFATSSLGDTAPSERPAEVDEILDAERRWIGWTALVPVWGLWKAARSDLHTPAERWRLGALSMLTTASLAGLLWIAQPTAAERDERIERTVREQLRALVTLVETYRAQYGRFPDEAAWSESAQRTDRRFRDPWDRPYVYEPTRDGFRVGTYGADGARGGAGPGRDIFVERAG